MLLMFQPEWDAWMARAHGQHRVFRAVHNLQRFKMEPIVTGQRRIDADFETALSSLVQFSNEVDVTEVAGHEKIGILQPDFAVWLVQNTWSNY